MYTNKIELSKTFQFILANDKKINVDKGKFDGDINFAVSFIEDFCKKILSLILDLEVMVLYRLMIQNIP